MENDEVYRNEYIAKEYMRAIADTEALQDQSLTMAVAADGVKPFIQYGTPLGMMLTRTGNAIRSRSPRRLFGIPDADGLRKAIRSGGVDRDKVLWSSTAKASSIATTSND